MMITLYELHWSHYCEKVRLALDHMGLEWRMVGIDAFNKRPLREHPLPPHLPGHTVPAIHDDCSDAFVMDSTPILRYLAARYTDAPSLFPGDQANSAAIDAQLIEFDTLLGIPARRFGYTQVILECPDLLADLFLAHRNKGLFGKPIIRAIAGTCLGMLLSKRFAFHRSESLGLYEALEAYLLRLAARLEGREFIVGEQFSAADIAFAAQIRPITVVPFFAEHPQLQGLFERHRKTIASCHGEESFPYQTGIAQARMRKPPMRRKLREITASLPFQSHGDLSGNDQNRVWTWGMLAMPFHYFVSLRSRKVRQSLATSNVR
jgi:glutathione S-transferase